MKQSHVGYSPSKVSRSRKSLLALSLAVGACAAVAFADDRDDRPRVNVEARVGIDITFGFTPPPAEVVAGYEQDLGTDGRWVDIQSYGRCWVPNNRPDNWRPYTVGHWTSTDEGWCWVAEGDETSWGDTCYHYGRWHDDADNGWVWVPGTVWAPSWVSWREGDGYSAWAPLPPECGDGVVVTPEVADAYIRPDDFVVCDQRFMASPDFRSHVEINNVTIINRTVNITKITYVDNRAVNQGVSVAHVQERSGRAIQTVHLQRATSAVEARKMASEGKPALYTPPHIEAHLKAHPIVTRTAPQPKEIAAHRATVVRRQPGQPPRTAHDPAKKTVNPERPDVKPKATEHPEKKPEPKVTERPERKPEPKVSEHPEKKPEPKATEHPEKKPDPRAHEEPKPPHDPKKKPEKPEDKHEEK